MGLIFFLPFFIFSTGAMLTHISASMAVTLNPNHLPSHTQTRRLPVLLLSHLFGDVVLDQAVEGNHAADFQQHGDGGRLLSAPASAATTATASMAPRRRHASPCPRHGLVMAQVAASWTAALLLAADLHAAHDVVGQQLTLLQRRQVADEGDRLELAPTTDSDPLLRGLWKTRGEGR